MISCSAVISRPVKTGETPPNEWDMAHVCPVHPVADGQVDDAHGSVVDQIPFGSQCRFPFSHVECRSGRTLRASV
jgi:hypothetical protein